MNTSQNIGVPNNANRTDIIIPDNTDLYQLVAQLIYITILQHTLNFTQFALICGYVSLYISQVIQQELKIIQACV